MIVTFAPCSGAETADSSTLCASANCRSQGLIKDPLYSYTVNKSPCEQEGWSATAQRSTDGRRGVLGLLIADELRTNSSVPPSKSWIPVYLKPRIETDREKVSGECSTIG